MPFWGWFCANSGFDRAFVWARDAVFKFEHTYTPQKGMFQHVFTL